MVLSMSSKFVIEKHVLFSVAFIRLFNTSVSLIRSAAHLSFGLIGIPPKSAFSKHSALTNHPNASSSNSETSPNKKSISDITSSCSTNSFLVASCCCKYNC
ncbi:hypothetical protein AX774_g7285 [Zancudomyces culisetae]|uniref:Uncharacterized protein n=1 Tax=Zancudomyces culisetae TaxID=1213189 RepID=A0A1R1PE85_ZANCU|nr:hypothetical protein AX774_g7285 [Zancudomyces culisetae]|eukprot:OMH79310.1 hypothetical protein AX774_g7285 [Zancudomyces culisetae]